MTQEIDVFISYKREEQPLAEQVAAALEASGYSQMSDLDLEVSEHFGDAIDRMIRAARVVLVLWTPEAANSDWVKSEARLGAELGTYLGIMVRPTELPVDLKFLQYEDVTEVPFDKTTSSVLRSVSEKLGPPTETTEQASRVSAELKEQRELFETMIALDSAKGFEAYLERYPDGVLADVAREEMKKRKALVFRLGTLRAFLPSAAFVGACAGLVGVFSSNAFQENYWGQRKELKSLEAKLDEAPKKQDLEDLKRQLSASETALLIAPDPRYVKDLEERLASAPSIEELAKRNAEVKELQTQIAALEQALEQSPHQDEYDALQEQLQVEKAQLQIARAQLYAAPDVAEYAKIKKELEASLSPDEAEALRHELSELQQKLEDVPNPDEYERIKNQLEAAPSQHEYDRLEGALAASKAREKRLREELDVAPDPKEFEELKELYSLLRNDIQLMTFEPDCKLPGTLRGGYSFPTIGCVDPSQHGLDLSGKQLNSMEMFKLRRLTDLSYLDLTGTNVTDFNFLSEFYRLRKLVLPNGQKIGGTPGAGLWKDQDDVRNWIEANTPR